VTSRRILDVLAKGSGAPSHNQTFSQFPISCAAGLATLRLMKAEGLIERCARMGEILQRRLATLLEHPNVGDVRGRGLFAGVEFVEDKASRKPFDPRLRVADTFTQAAQAAGLAVWPNAAYTEQENGDLVLIGPPFIITESEIDELVQRFGSALESAMETIRQRMGR